jgi:hypothetical protein
MTDKKEQRKQFRRDINQTPKRGETVQGDGCWLLAFPALLGFTLTFVLGWIGLAVLLP